MDGRRRGDRETLLLNLFFHDVNVAAGGHVDLNLIHPTDLVLLAKEEAVLQGMTERQTEIGRRCGMEMNVKKKKSEIATIWAAL